MQEIGKLGTITPPTRGGSRGWYTRLRTHQDVLREEQEKKRRKTDENEQRKEQFPKIEAEERQRQDVALRLSQRNRQLGVDIERLLSIPNETERSTLIAARVGQGSFRKSLLEYWESCVITGCKQPEILRASHIKPWCVCDDRERLDSFNGIILVPNFDTLFDLGFITFNTDGSVELSPFFGEFELAVFQHEKSLRVPFTERHQPYLQYHRTEVFLSSRINER